MKAQFDSLSQSRLRETSYVPGGKVHRPQALVAKSQSRLRETSYVPSRPDRWLHIRN